MSRAAAWLACDVAHHLLEVRDVCDYLTGGVANGTFFYHALSIVLDLLELGLAGFQLSGQLHFLIVVSFVALRLDLPNFQLILAPFFDCFRERVIELKDLVPHVPDKLLLSSDLV